MSADLPAPAWAAALAAVPELGPARLRRLLARWEPGEAWAAVRAGRADAVWGASEHPLQVQRAAPVVRREAGTVDPARLWERVSQAGVAVHLLGRAGYPASLGVDPAAPAVLFSRGDPSVLEGRRVTVVGTRNASGAGREVAAELGRGLAEHGVRVVSGLARGIDGWAHRGALAATQGAPPVGVVASGLDVVYPREHRDLWHQVAERGLLLSEVPPGSRPLAHRFPLRNRVLAALGEVVVVVESRHRGGSQHTVEEALRRGLTVMAVPGSPRNPAAEGTNQLLIDGATPVVGPADVLVALGFERPAERPAERASRPEARADPGDQWALDALGADRCDLDRLVRLTGCDLVEAAVTLGRLEGAGLVRSQGGWYERVGGTTTRRRAAAP